MGISIASYSFLQSMELLVPLKVGHWKDTLFYRQVALNINFNIKTRKKKACGPALPVEGTAQLMPVGRSRPSPCQSGLGWGRAPNGPWQPILNPNCLQTPFLTYVGSLPACLQALFSLVWALSPRVCVGTIMVVSPLRLGYPKIKNNVR